MPKTTTTPQAFFDSLTPKVMERFFANVMPEPMSGCHLWAASTNHDGYGAFSVGGAMVKAHRIALAIRLGRDVEGHALHSCDVPACCNPDHLREGTHAENMRDRGERGRSARQPGESHGRAKLTESQVREILALAGTMTQKAIAQRFGVSRPLVSRIISRKLWAHVTP
jgi:hypothetical protein